MQLFVRKTKPVRFTSAACACCNWPTRPCHCCVPPSATSALAVALLGVAHGNRMHSCFQWLMPTIDQFRDAWPEVNSTSRQLLLRAACGPARGDLDLG